MKKIILLSMFALILSCSQNYIKNEVIIGDQVWSVKNLNVDKFNNGDYIPECKTILEWKKASKNGTPAWCNYDNDYLNGEKYGKLYNWYALNDPRGIAPKGWHIPSEKEWIKLSTYLGGENIAGDKMKSKEGWDVSGNGNNESKFNGFPGGFRFGNGEFGNITGLGSFWSTTEFQISYVDVLILDYGTSTASFTPFEKAFGASIRCIKN